MQFANPFDARQVEPTSFPPPPPLADYHVQIVESEAKPTSDQSGGYLQLVIEILDPGPYLKRRVNKNLNLFNQSQKAVEIAYRELSAICYVTGVFNVQDSRQLHNIPFIATIGPQKNDPRYAEVFEVKDINGNRPGKGAAPTAPQPVAAPVAAPAWAPVPAASPAQPQAPWGSPPAAAPAAPTWGAPAPSAPPTTAAPVWPPQAAPAPTAAQPAAQPPWAPAGTPAAPPWAR